MPKWKQWLAIGTIFLSGALIGALGARFYIKHLIEEALSGGPPARKELVMKRLRRELDLGPRQAEEIEVIVTGIQEDLLELRRRSQPQVRAILERGVKRMKSRLDPAQQRKLSELYEKLERFRRGPYPRSSAGDG